MDVVKIAVVGDGGVGKTSFLNSKKNKGFNSNQPITIGINYVLIPFNIKNEKNRSGTFLMMDLGGQERFHFIHDAYIKGIKAALILFDLTRIKTLMHIPNWIKLIEAENSSIPIIIIGNKMDLLRPNQFQKIADNIGLFIEDLPEKHNILGFNLSSAKDKIGIDEIFVMCEELLLNSTLQAKIPKKEYLSEQILHQFNQIII